MVVLSNTKLVVRRAVSSSCYFQAAHDLCIRYCITYRDRKLGAGIRGAWSFLSFFSRHAPASNSLDFGRHGLCNVARWAMPSHQAVLLVDARRASFLARRIGKIPHLAMLWGTSDIHELHWLFNSTPSATQGCFSGY